MKYLFFSLIALITAGLWAQVSPLPITSYDYATP